MSVIHITPQLPPALCGVGDYATVVGARMEKLSPDVRCGYLAAGHRVEQDADQVAVTPPPFTRRLAAGEKGAALWLAVGELAGELPCRNSELATVILHYSGYGYDPSGAPTWLAEAIERRPEAMAGCRVVTFFHELYATGRPWERAFWSSGRQRATAIRVARASDAVLTNREQSARWLEEHTGLAAGSIPNLPICSNVGEPTDIVPWEDRLPQAVLFGGARFKRPFLVGDGAMKTAQLCWKAGVKKVIDIGQACECDTRPFQEFGIEVTHTGYLKSAEITPQMRDARVGLLYYPPHVLEKSGVVAAMTAHGLGIVTPRAMAPLPFEGVVLEEAATDEHEFSERLVHRLQASSQSARKWYAGHAIEKHAAAILASTRSESTLLNRRPRRRVSML